MRAGTGSPLTFFAAVLVAVLAGCTSEESTSPQPSASPSAAAPARTIVPVPTSLQEIPGQPPVVHYGTVDNPEIGVAYEYHLYVHCGIRAAKFGGHWWLAVFPTNDRPFAGDGATRPLNPNYLDGAMTLVAPDLARFEWVDGSADFTPALTEPPPCA
jgi:hypothetical protein